jgi:poly(beta-D-mannuronate) lyase
MAAVRWRRGLALAALIGVDTAARAIDFLLDGIEDPALVLPYAQVNVNPGPFRSYPVQDLDFLAHRGHGRHHMAWTEPYVARLPESTTARRLRDLLAERGVEEP